MNYPPNYARFIGVLKKYYEGRDSSHGWEHVEKVCQNAISLCSESEKFNERDLKIIIITALGHDIWDHKYVNEEEEEAIKEKFIEDLMELGFMAMDRDLIIRIIDSISFSTEYQMRQKGKDFDLEVPEERLRHIVSDADKLEALGKICIIRMIEYEIISNEEEVPLEQHMRHIQRHCQEKLYLLIDKGYIRTKAAIMRAKPLMEEMKSIVDNDEILEKFIKEYLKNRE